jgi:hypothetical protein
MHRGARLQARASLPAWLPRQAHRPRYSEGPAAPRTKRAYPPRAGRPLVCWRSQAVGPGLRLGLGASSAPDWFPPGPSSQRLRPIPEVTSAGPGTRVPGRGKPRASQGRANTFRTPGETASRRSRVPPDRALPRMTSPSRAGQASRHQAPRASRVKHDSDRAEAWVNGPSHARRSAHWRPVPLPRPTSDRASSAPTSPRLQATNPPPLPNQAAWADPAHG